MKFIKNFVRKFGLDIVGYKTYNGHPDPLVPWETNQAFLDIYQQVIPVTLVDRKKLYMLWQLVQRTSHIEGSLAECGVYQGGTALLLAKTKAKGKDLHLFDTFEGMPETDKKRDEHNAGDFNNTSLEAVSKLFVNEANVSFHKGFFPATTKGIEGKRFSFVHCDMDIYQSIYDFCEFFYPLLSPGGVMIFDDYGSPSCPGAKQAVEEFCDKYKVYHIYLPSGQAIITRY